MEAYSNLFYFNHLPKLELILRSKIIERFPEDSRINLGSCINAFFDFYHDISAFDFFEKDLIEKDDMHLAICMYGHSKYIRLQRTLTCNYNFDDNFLCENYEIIFTLNLRNYDDDKIINTCYEIEQNEKGNFTIYDKNVDFENYKKTIFESDFIRKHYNDNPISQSIKLNANA